MMTFGEYLESMRAAIPSPAHLSQATAFSLAFPGKEDTKRAIDRARKLGRSVTPEDLRAAVSPESQQTARNGVFKNNENLGTRG